MELPLEVDHAMLMITVEKDRALVTLRLEGQLSLPEVRELARTRDMAAFERPDCRLSIDVTDVVEIDRHGREFLAHLQRRGDCIVRSGATRATSTRCSLPMRVLHRLPEH
ncbi:MAG: hypothetical protein DMF89_27245 [Acidobacteria bacterium]|nr:MAG: hypothetical protein DMF98_20080 [Acidobacteriota bacterium]PYR44693.1 MAG: hypothetical protein DMF89_27245 [Acidobacteriota bacterium]